MTPASAGRLCFSYGHETSIGDIVQRDGAPPSALPASTPPSSAAPEPLLAPVASLSLDDGAQPLMERTTSRYATRESERELRIMRIDLLREEIEQEPVERVGLFHRGEVTGVRDDGHAGTRDPGGVR